MLHVYHSEKDALTPGHALAEFHFGANVRCSEDPRHIPVELAQLGGDSRIERWSTGSAVSTGQRDGFNFAHDGEYLFASIVVPPSRCADIERATCSAYLHLDALIRRQGYPFWLRAWNYLANITEGEGEAERYRRFNSGRHKAVALASGIDKNLPAASALGSESGSFVLCCLAGRNPGVQIENPRQVSAPLYPPRYGLRSPMFARAALVPNANGAQLLVSGTASIVGHESLHAGDARAQLEETARNFEALLEAATRDPQRARYSRARLESLKVYLRDDDDYAPLIAHIRRLFAVEAAPMCLRADICRRELLVEIEGTYALE